MNCRRLERGSDRDYPRHPYLGFEIGRIRAGAAAEVIRSDSNQGVDAAPAQPGAGSVLNHVGAGHAAEPSELDGGKTVGAGLESPCLWLEPLLRERILLAGSSCREVRMLVTRDWNCHIAWLDQSRMRELTPVRTFCRSIRRCKSDGKGVTSPCSIKSRICQVGYHVRFSAVGTPRHGTNQYRPVSPELDSHRNRCSHSNSTRYGTRGRYRGPACASCRHGNSSLSSGSRSC